MHDQAGSQLGQRFEVGIEGPYDEIMREGRRGNDGVHWCCSAFSCGGDREDLGQVLGNALIDGERNKAPSAREGRLPHSAQRARSPADAHAQLGEGRDRNPCFARGRRSFRAESLGRC